MMQLEQLEVEQLGPDLRNISAEDLRRRRSAQDLMKRQHGLREFHWLVADVRREDPSAIALEDSFGDPGAKSYAVRWDYDEKSEMYPVSKGVGLVATPDGLLHVFFTEEPIMPGLEKWDEVQNSPAYREFLKPTIRGKSLDEIVKFAKDNLAQPTPDSRRVREANPRDRSYFYYYERDLR